MRRVITTAAAALLAAIADRPISARNMSEIFTYEAGLFECSLAKAILRRRPLRRKGIVHLAVRGS
jgi:hypothetical protein